jgi:hypothetical protein
MIGVHLSLLSVTKTVAMWYRVLPVVYNCVRDRHVDLTAGHVQKEKRHLLQHPYPTESRPLMLPAGFFHSYHLTLARECTN